MTEMVCAKCGGDRINVEFTAHGHGKAEIGVDSKGRPYVDHVYDRDTVDEEYDDYSCADCKATWISLADGLQPKLQAGINLRPGDVVWLPDGFKGTVATVDTEANTFTVEGWHEVFQAGEGELLLPLERVAA